MLDLLKDHELIVKHFAALAIGSICMFSVLYLFLYLSELTIFSAVRVVIWVSKVTFKSAVKIMLVSLQAVVLCLANLFLRPLVPSMAVSLKFRTFQCCRKIWIILTTEQQPPVVVEDPTVYVYDPRGRTFQSFDPNWKPMLGEYKRKLAKKRQLQKIRQLRGQTNDDGRLKGIHQTLSAENQRRSCWSTPPRKCIVASSLAASKTQKGRAGSPASLADTITDSDTDSNVSHREMGFLEYEHERNKVLCNSFTVVESLDDHAY